MSNREDKRTLGVTQQGADDLAALFESGWFKEEMDVYRLAIGVAVGKDLAPDEGEVQGVTTKWNIGTIDFDGRLRRLITASSGSPVARPYADAEKRAAAGLRFLRVRIVD